MRRLWVWLTLTMSIMSAQTVGAWNEVGHMVVARIAYERLTDAERAVIGSTLRHHPHLHELLLKGRPPQVSEDEWIFLRAATWPDNVRPPRVAGREPVAVHPIYRFHHGNWHYANFEYQAGQTETALPRRTLPHHPEPADPAQRTNIIEQLDRSYAIVRGLEREQSHPEVELDPAEIRAVRLCWLFHLMGDIHQPLHIATLVDDRIPALRHGDEGGNKLAVRTNHGTAPHKLHALWDDLLGTNPHFERVVNLAEMLSHNPRLASARLPDFANHRQAWEIAEESYQDAKEVVYQNGHLHFALWSRVESHEIRPEDVPTLPQQWIDQAHSLAEKRIALAGYRLADRLKFIVSRDTGGNIARIPNPAIPRNQPTPR